MKASFLTGFVLAILLLNAPAAAQTSEFAYQGNLKDGGSAANGNYDLEFALFDSAAGGTQLGSTLTRNGVVVSDGSFSTKLDFGNQFPGANRFLEIKVRAAGGGSFTTLAPRQLINSTPYAVRSLTSETAAVASSAANATNAATAANAIQLGGVAANQYVVTGDARLSDARNPLAGSANYIQNQNGAAQAASNFNISGNGTAGGTFSGNIVNAATQFNLNGQRAVFANADQSLAVGILAGANGTGGSNSFFGFRAGESNSTGIGNSFFGSQSGAGNTTAGGNTYFGMWAGRENRTGSNNAFVGMHSGLNNTGSSNSFFGSTSGSSNTTGAANTFMGNASGTQHTTGSFNTFVGHGAGNTSTIGSFNTFVGSTSDFSANNITGGSNTLLGYGTKITTAVSNSTAIGANAAATQSNTLILGGITGTNNGTSVNVGIGTTTPSEKLHVAGNGLFTGNVTVGGTLSATLPPGSGSYINNTTSQQPTSNFNISGIGTANIINSVTQFNLNSVRVLGTPGSQNVFVGQGAGTNNINNFTSEGIGGFRNSFVGSSAGLSNTHGSENTFFGAEAGRQSTEASTNSFFGARSGMLSNGGANSFFGYQSGGENSTGIFNTFIGINAGKKNTTGFNNVTLGAVSDLGSINLSNAAAIGTSSLVNCSDCMVLGSIKNINGATTDTNVGIGTTTPTNRLHITANGGNVILGNPGCNAGFAAIGFGSTLAGCSNYSLLGDGTNTIISRPVGGVIEFRQGNTAQASIDANGLFSIVTLGTGGITALCKNGSSQISVCSSSLRYKTNIGSFGSGLDVIKRLRPITFDWKDGGTRDLGLGAEDVAKVEPLLVTYDKNGQVEGVKYDRVGVVLVNAVKEQQGQIETQNKEIGQLKDMIGKQQEQIDELRKAIRAMGPAPARDQKP